MQNFSQLKLSYLPGIALLSVSSGLDLADYGLDIAVGVLGGVAIGGSIFMVAVIGKF